MSWNCTSFCSSMFGNSLNKIHDPAAIVQGAPGRMEAPAQLDSGSNVPGCSVYRPYFASVC
jgi:hypothetical protein